MNGHPKDSSPPVAVRLARSDEFDAMAAMYREHLAVLARFNPTVNPDNSMDADWFEKPGVLFPWWLVRGHDRVGFALMGNHRLARAMGSDQDFLVFEFFVCESERRTGVGRVAIDLLFAEHPGSWSVSVLPENAPAMAFWRGTLEPRGGRASDHLDEEGIKFLRYSVPAP